MGYDASLRQAVKTRGPLRTWRALKLGTEVGEALEGIASRGWSCNHLDPRNIHPDTPKGESCSPSTAPGRPAGRPDPPVGPATAPPSSPRRVR